MANNTRLNQNVTVGDLIATLEIGPVKHERVIVEFLDDLGEPIMVNSGNPLPVTFTLTRGFQFITATAGQTLFVFGNVPSSYSDYMIFANGIAIEPITEYTTIGDNITLATPRDLGDRIRLQIF